MRAAIARATLVAISGALVLSNLPPARLPFAGRALLFLLMLPAALGLSLVAVGLRAILHARAPGRQAAIARGVVIAEGVLLSAAAGVYTVNYFVVDSPFGRCARIGYALSAALTLLVLLATRRLRLAAIDARTLDLVLAAAFFADACVAVGLGVYGMSAVYGMRGPTILLALGGCCAALACALPVGLGRRACATAGVVLAVAVVAFGIGDRRRAFDKVARLRTGQAELLLYARKLTDGDGDGYSAWLGGGDCDDRDASAYPLSPTRDCFGWRGKPSCAPRAAAPAPAPSDAPPRIILFLSIDTMRCGFGVRDRPELRDACPRMTRLAHQGRLRLDVHTSAPSTTPAMTAAMTGSPLPPRSTAHLEPTLPERLRRLGYRTTALVTFPQAIADPRVRAAFDVVDERLLSNTLSPFRGDELSERAFAEVRAALAGEQRAFVWAHYPDLHFPYILDDSPWKHGSITEYAYLLGRIDAAIGRLCDRISALPGGDGVMVVITADHGEDFYEHGVRYHGSSLYEPAVRIPFVVWSAGAAHRRYGSARLPSQLADLGPYLLDAVGEASFVPRDETLLRAGALDDLVGVVSNGYKLVYDRTRNLVRLYDLTRDPDERHNLARKQPQLVQRVGHRLGRLLAAENALPPR